MLIITGSDDNYVPGVLVLIASAAHHNPTARFAVLDMNISPTNRRRIDALAARLNVEITRVEVDAERLAVMHVAREHLNQSAYLRLLIPDLFPAEDRVIYMDCDMVVMGDLTPLAVMDLAENMIAAVPCPSPDPLELHATGHRKGTYVNSGLLVMNLPIWRKERVAEKCISLVTDPTRRLLSEDQSAINIVARGRTTLLSLKYNTYSDPGSYNDQTEFPDDPIVLHYVVNNKPWSSTPPMSPIWHAHAEPIAAYMPDEKEKSVRSRISRINRWRKETIGLAMKRPKYILKKNLLNKMDGEVTQSYLAALKSPKKH